MKALNLVYKGSIGKTHNLKINYAKDGLSETEIRKAMQDLAKTKAFVQDDEELYVTPIAAKYVTTTEEYVFNDLKK